MRVVLLFSGGVDSTTLSYQMIEEGHELHLLSVWYGQQHGPRELYAARKLVALMPGSPPPRHTQINLFLHECLRGSALTDGTISLPLDVSSVDGNQSLTVVPNRNAILLSVAGAMAVSTEADAIAIGANIGDRTIYPDCRQVFFSAYEEALYHGTGKRIRVMAPFVTMTKREVVALARHLGVPIEQTWSCYTGNDQSCGRCGACLARSEALHG